MRNLLQRLWADEAGFIISAELVLVATIVGLGMCVGLAEISSAVNHELHDCAQSFAACNGDGDSNWEDEGLWSSESEHEQSEDDFGGNY